MEDGTPLRERLVDVGVEIVATEGIAALGLREIARRAGVSHGAPRRHFPTHRSLLSAIAGRGFDALKDRLGTCLGPDGDPRAQVCLLAEAYVGFAVEHRPMFELMFRHDLLDSGDEADGRSRLREKTLPLFASLVDLIARHRQTAARPPATGPGPAPDVVAAALWANLHGIAQLWSWGSLSLTLDAPSPGDPRAHETLAPLIARAVDTHLGPAHP
ncbi:TetR/AcrR family transcriptional regulator [Streptomyces filamentosus]|uniref:TetR/AcrR family transcriptional regulator n=1 Tax=Streptomyces filamentosus TaxID=67294 RepID=A0ABY4UP55_STRFL|nr:MULTISPECIES: TetR/AcrR family transcriptional regulator [Streptomyces]ESU47055.1 TetR family transcriptional regulator [Streptomyces sp. HCCB10043]EWS95551.1 TetR family transcriptional regulator [Streptomyces filamentosus NRRL 11379]MYR82544.1 TetR family transcriptional regulator [Streptomyces sp. SID5466]USC46021.1 TetR/AcrR family transcriptional regulator [Streptomyces filamentosus]